MRGDDAPRDTIELTRHEHARRRRNLLAQSHGNVVDAVQALGGERGARRAHHADLYQRSLHGPLQARTRGAPQALGSRRTCGGRDAVPYRWCNPCAPDTGALSALHHAPGDTDDTGSVASLQTSCHAGRSQSRGNKGSAARGSSSCLALILVVLLLSDTQRGEQINRAETPSTHSPTVSQSHYAFPASAPHPLSSIALPSPPTCRSPSRNLPFAGRRR